MSAELAREIRASLLEAGRTELGPDGLLGVPPEHVVLVGVLHGEAGPEPLVEVLVRDQAIIRALVGLPREHAELVPLDALASSPTHVAIGAVFAGLSVELVPRRFPFIASPEA